MPNREQLQSLLGRIETATGPDLDLDYAIPRALFRPGFGRLDWTTTDREYYPPITASIDSALALVERVLPGWGVGMGRSPDGMAQGQMFPAHARRPPFSYRADHKSSVPLALLAALLSALISESQPKQETQSTEEGT